MRTEPSSPLALARLRAPAGRARRWLAARGAATRIGLLLAGLGVLGAAGYLASLDDPPDRNWAWLFEGRRLSDDDINAIDEALDAEGIAHAFNRPAGRVGVKHELKVAALVALAKRKVVPPTLDELSKDDDALNAWTSTAEDRERHERRRLEQRLKRQIERVDPSITTAQVEIHRVKDRRGLGPRERVSAYVYLVTEGGRELGHRAIKGIQRFLTGGVPDLKAEGITVVDETGREYLAAGNSSLEERMQAHAQEEEWRDRISDGLRHIPGLGVSVLLEAVAAPPPPPEPLPAPAAEAVRPNGPLEVGPDRLAAPAVPPPPAAAIKARVWVRVPRSFYLLAAQAQSPANRRASDEELQSLKETTERLARDAVEANIPQDVLGEVKVVTVQDDLSNPRMLVLPPASDSRRAWAWPALYGGAGVAAMGLVATLLRLATRRPAPRPPSPSAWRPGFVADGPSGPVPGPSERVRELIRTSPDAAAGVLQRWIGQGGAPG